MKPYKLIEVPFTPICKTLIKAKYIIFKEKVIGVFYQSNLDEQEIADKNYLPAGEDPPSLPALVLLVHLPRQSVFALLFALSLRLILDLCLMEPYIQPFFCSDIFLGRGVRIIYK